MPLLEEVPVPVTIEPVPAIALVLERSAVTVPLLVSEPVFVTVLCVTEPVFVTVLLKVVFPVPLTLLSSVPPLNATFAELLKFEFKAFALANETVPPVTLKLFAMLDPLLIVCVPPVTDKLPLVAEITPELIESPELRVTLPPVIASVEPEARLKFAPLLI